MGTTCCSPNVETKEMIQGPNGVTIIDPDAEMKLSKEPESKVRDHLKSSTQDSKPNSPEPAAPHHGDLTRRTNLPGDTPPKPQTKTAPVITKEKKVSAVRNNLKNL